MTKSIIISVSLTLAIILWMLSGYLVAPTNDVITVSPSAETESAATAMTVEIRPSVSSQVALHIVAQGQVEPNREVSVRAETEGRVAEIIAVEGQPVHTGDVLVRLEPGDRLVRLQKAEALIQEKQRAYDSVRQLGKQGLQAERLVDESYSALRIAQADLAEIRQEIGHTTIVAPFDGILALRTVEIGDYLAVNGEVATIVDNNPLVVSAHIAQQSIGRFGLDALADVTLATGQQRQGRVRFIAPRADSATRTFRVEIEIPNPDSRLPSGTSAEAHIPAGEATAHLVSPALLSLNDTGQIGIKTVSNDNIVEFHPTTIVLAEPQGVWVSGLPEQVRIITVGQGFVRQGEAVNVVVQADRKTSSALVQHSVLPMSEDRRRSDGVAL